MKKLYIYFYLTSILLFIPFLFSRIKENSSPSVPTGLYITLPPSHFPILKDSMVEVENPMISGWIGKETKYNLLKRVEGITKDGLYILSGDKEWGNRSYDSRYFGAVGKDFLVSICIPLYIKKNNFSEEI